MFKNRRTTIKIISIITILVIMTCIAGEAFFKTSKPTTILYSTDLFINGDFDDYFDLVSMEAMENIDLKIIVDGNDEIEKKTGVLAIENLNKCGGGVSLDSVIIGRDNNLSSLKDPEVSDKLVQTLKDAEGNVKIVTVGSLRDIAALYNSSPELFERKVNQIWVFAGDAEGTSKEWNVGLDETAFLRIMNCENLNIYWIPCIQNETDLFGSNASYFMMKHEEALGNAPYQLQKWFLHRYEKSEMDFAEYMSKDIDVAQFMSETRNMWCASIFPLINGNIEQYLNAYNHERGTNIELPFGFTEKKVLFSEGGKVQFGTGNTINMFEIYDYDEYVDFSKYILRSIYSNWNVAN